MSRPKRLIEVDLPIAHISLNASREKESRRGHVPLMYIWPATRPTSACRAVLLAALLPDPVDPACPAVFRRDAARLMKEWASTHAYKVSADISKRLRDLASARNEPSVGDLRQLLLDFIGEYSNPAAVEDDTFVQVARTLASKAHAALGQLDGNRPVVLDSFAGGGAIPLEALRLECDAIAGELNPVAVLYEKVLLEYLPAFGTRLISAFEEIVDDATQRVGQELNVFYPPDEDGAVPIAYLWARTVLSEEPTDSPPVEVPMIKSFWLAKGRASTALRWRRDESGQIECARRQIRYADGRELLVRQPLLEVFQPRRPEDVPEGTSRGTAACCPISGYVTPPASVRRQLRARKGGADDARLFAVVSVTPGRRGRTYRVADRRDENAAAAAAQEARTRMANRVGMSAIPQEPLPETMAGVIRPPTFGATNMSDLYSPRQRLFLSAVVQVVRDSIDRREWDPVFREAVATAAALFVNRLADLNASLCAWQLSTPNAAHVFTRWDLPMIFDYAEVNPLAAAGGSPASVRKRLLAGMHAVERASLRPGTVISSDARRLPLPDDSVDVFLTDPPYYNAVPYADFSDYFYVWMRRVLAGYHNDLLASELSPKTDELCEMAGWDSSRYPEKDKHFFERGMQQALAEGRRVLKPTGITVLVFAHKSTAGWEALLGALIGAGWTITASWPIDTEMGSRMRAQGAAVLASSVHLVCQPREDYAGQLAESVGDWRDVLAELGPRIRDWLPRLSKEGIVGADAIFACIGPALEIFSRYSRVEKTAGDLVTLREYLEHVWAAVAREALSLLFVDADASGLEPDARLTAMWLWTLRHSSTPEPASGSNGGVSAARKGWALEYDAARKIAQGLGANLEDLPTIVEVKGDTAWLLGVQQRVAHLTSSPEPAASRQVPRQQLDLFAKEPETGDDKLEIGDFEPGGTVLDRLHQAMLLFGSGRSSALQRFLSDGTGSEVRFWSLAQALSALYPAGSSEKRWVDGVLARKKGFGY